ncbi:winged helix-turn-helix transcriptional regulator [Frankia sp. AgB1.9]|uniref:MarR family winged helix-turn-helix transcriptional regulator n=1 Tax=unclassified Frankia TaxID=2632575 RepID=UPI0019335EAD|nr:MULTISPECIES: MarR family winged helix-turn-helix transcriptional regulator [unclassified Frankia]MBL7489656.1 winged helix-turn-helix transcriptional regulator [Frankia sp. AgW1.1]MBL7548622.1 winged helix-turn-helix transcriptional regulator [Frankia sp. AgB1.9]MBL7621574.1 winged helix-turn-helix transcriptional regulator [Frankia sp. AgB1.8]
MKRTATAPGRVEPPEDVAALEGLTRTLVGITLASLDALDGAVSVPRFRALLTLDALGRVPSSTLASELGMVASSVTRLVDRLQASGHVARGADPANRSVVTVEVTDTGRDLVTAVLNRRHALLETVLDRMGPDQREEVRRAAREVTRCAGETVVPASSPLPL